MSHALTLQSIYQDHAGYVASVARNRLRDSSEVDDTVQEVFLKASHCLSSVREPRAVRGWLRTITVRVVSRRIDKAVRQRRLNEAYGLSLFSSSQRSDLGLEDLREALRNLPEDERHCWLLRHVKGLTFNETAEACQISVPTARRRYGRAKQRLAERLN